MMNDRWTVKPSRRDAEHFERTLAVSGFWAHLEARRHRGSDFSLTPATSSASSCVSSPPSSILLHSVDRQKNAASTVSAPQASLSRMAGVSSKSTVGADGDALERPDDTLAPYAKVLSVLDEDELESLVRYVDVQLHKCGTSLDAMGRDGAMTVSERLLSERVAQAAFLACMQHYFI